MTLGSIRLAVQPNDEVEELLRQGLAILTQALPAGHWRIAEAESRLGAGLAARDKAAEAEPLLVSGYEGLLRGRGARSGKTVAALERLIAFYEGQGNATAVVAYRAKLPH